MQEHWKSLTRIGAMTVIVAAINLIWHAVAAHAATSGWPVDTAVTSFTTFTGTTVANGLFNGGLCGVAGHMVGGFEWGRAMNVSLGSLGGGSILTNANGIAGVVGVSPGATIHPHHPLVTTLAHHVARLVG